MKVSDFTALIFLYILQNQIKSDVLFRLRVALKKRMKILFFSIYPSLHRRRTVSGFKPVLCSRRTAVRQHQNNSQPLTFLSFDLFEKVFRTLRSTTKGVASGHHHLLQKVDENFIILLYPFCDAAGTNGDVIIVVIIAAQAGSRGDVVAQRLQIAVGSKMVQHR